MKLSMKWLCDYVDLKDVTPREFAEKMSLSGSKVESFQRENDNIERVVVGEIQSINPHPNADKLVICQVDVGESKPLQIVTGASNVVEGARVPVCLGGARLPDGTRIKPGKLRGVLSEGMMCSLGELGLTRSDFPYAVEDGIFLIEEPCKVGQDIGSAIGLDDLCVEFEITSNRPDCLSVRGLAREASATFSVPFSDKPITLKESGGQLQDQLRVTVSSPLCKRYMARMVRNVNIKPSPRWMRERLRACGVRPINNLVDITNYVMLEYGQPMHAFDARYIEGGQIVVRQAANGESITTLDKTSHTLNESVLVICDEKKPLAVAGVMGGEHSGIMDDTKTVVFESASFDGASVRSAAKLLSLRTESSARFEKGLNPACCQDPLARACELVEELGAGEVVGGVIDQRNCEMRPQTVRFTPNWINQFLGLSLSSEEMIDILQRLQFRIEGDEIIVPPERIDIAHKADIAEEIARIYGYDKIPSTVIRGVSQAAFTPIQKFTKQVRQSLLSVGCSEVCTYSFMSQKCYDKLGFDADHPLRDSIRIRNPLGEDTGVMRTTTLSSMLGLLSRNYNNRNDKAWAYELGKVYLPTEQEDEPLEREMVTLGLFGGCDFYTLKGMIETLLRSLHIAGFSFEPAEDMPFHPYRCANVLQGGRLLGTFGEVHPQVLENYEIGAKAYLAELSLQALFEAKDEEIVYRPLPKFPASTRDLSLVCSEELPAAALEKEIKAGVGAVLESIALFDVYRGEQIKKGQKSISYTLTLRAADRTLTDQEADAAVKRALKRLEAIGVQLRK